MTTENQKVAFREERIPIEGMNPRLLGRVRIALNNFGEDTPLEVIRFQRGAEINGVFHPCALEMFGKTLPQEEFFAETGLNVGYFIGKGSNKRLFTTSLTASGASPEQAVQDLLRTLDRPSRIALSGWQKLKPWRALVVRFDADGGYKARRPLLCGVIKHGYDRIAVKIAPSQ